MVKIISNTLAILPPQPTGTGRFRAHYVVTMQFATEEIKEQRDYNFSIAIAEDRSGTQVITRPSGTFGARIIVVPPGNDDVIVGNFDDRFSISKLSINNSSLIRDETILLEPRKIDTSKAYFSKIRVSPDLTNDEDQSLSVEVQEEASE